MESGLPLRQVAASMKAHGIDVSYQSVNSYSGEFVIQKREWKVAEVTLTTLFLLQTDPFSETAEHLDLTEGDKDAWLRAIANDEDLFTFALKQVRIIQKHFERAAWSWKSYAQTLEILGKVDKHDKK